jgi:deoxyribodipyrimidine photo-lyase
MKSLLRFALAIGMVPALALGLLMLTREVRPVPGLAALGLVLLGSLALAWGWRARLALLAEALRDALAQVRAAPTRTEPAPLPSAEDLADGIRRLAREAWQRSQGGSRGAEVWLSELIWRDFYHQPYLKSRLSLMTLSQSSKMLIMKLSL